MPLLRSGKTLALKMKKQCSSPRMQRATMSHQKMGTL